MLFTRKREHFPVKIRSKKEHHDQIASLPVLFRIGLWQIKNRQYVFGVGSKPGGWVTILHWCR